MTNNAQVVEQQFGILPRGDRNLWQWGVDQTKLDYIQEPISSAKYIWSDEGLQFNRFTQNQFPDWSDPNPTKTAETAKRYAELGGLGNKAKAFTTKIPTQVGKFGKLGLAALPIIGTGLTIAEAPLRIAAGQQWDDAIVSTIGGIVGGTIGSLGGATVGAFGGPVGSIAGTIGGGYLGATQGANAFNWAWGKITGDDTWGGVREDPKIAQARETEASATQQQQQMSLPQNTEMATNNMATTLPQPSYDKGRAAADIYSSGNKLSLEELRSPYYATNGVTLEEQRKRSNSQRYATL